MPREIEGEYSTWHRDRGGPDLTADEMAPPELPAAALMNRRRFMLLAGGGAAAAAAALYTGVSLLERPDRAVVEPPARGYPAGQYQIAQYGVRVRADPQSGVDVIVPPVWNVAVTARLTRKPGPAERSRLRAALTAVESAYPYAPGGVFTLVAYGLPYFRSYIPASVLTASMPRMKDSDVPVLLDAVRFAADPASIALEENDLLLHFRSDNLANLHDVQHALFAGGGTLAGRPARADLSELLQVTSIRTGFIGAGLPRRMAEHAGLAFAGHIPEESPLFMGFTSTQQLGQARERAVAFDQPPDPLLRPLTTARPGDYFAGGTAVHLSHLSEDLNAWYALPYEERAGRMFHRNAVAPAGRITVQTLWLNPNPSALDARERHILGHNETVQRGSRTPEGQALQLRVDFNTMDPMDASAPHPGVHFMAFTPGSEIFHRSRRAMDAVKLAGRYHIPASANGINSFIRATRRQNFLVPPRRHRVFPLSELER